MPATSILVDFRQEQGRCWNSDCVVRLAHIALDTGRIRFSRTFVGGPGSAASLRHLSHCPGGASGIDVDAGLARIIFFPAVVSLRPSVSQMLRTNVQNDTALWRSFRHISAKDESRTRLAFVFAFCHIGQTARQNSLGEKWWARAFRTRDDDSSSRVRF